MPPVVKELTELVEINPLRVDLVRTPANGFPVLLMKAVNAQGGVNEKPDIDGAEHVLQILAQLIQAEAAEMAVGNWEEICDIELLCEAAHLMRCFKRHEEWGDEDDGEPMAKDAFPSEGELTEVVTYLAKRKVTAAERKRLADEGKALPDGSYPIENTEDLKNAAILARSGHGDVAAARRLIAKRAKELGVANPLADSASKDADVNTNPTNPTEPTNVEPAEKSAVDFEEAVAKANKPLIETIEGLRAEMAVLKATPVPGGPAISAAAIQGAAAKSAKTSADAERFERLAKDTQDRELARYYADRAREARATA